VNKIGGKRFEKVSEGKGEVYALSEGNSMNPFDNFLQTEIGVFFWGVWFGGGVFCGVGLAELGGGGRGGADST